MAASCSSSEGDIASSQLSGEPEVSDTVPGQRLKGVSTCSILSKLNYYAYWRHCIMRIIPKIMLAWFAKAYL